MLKTKRRARRIVRDPQPRYWISDEVFGEVPDPRTRSQRLLIRSLAFLLPAIALLVFFIGFILIARP
jgi:hypothetical protein